MKTIFEMMSLHCVPYILYWIQAEWKFYIQTYCQIIWVNFTNVVAIIFFQADVHIWLTSPPSPCPHLSTFAWPPSIPPLMCGHPLWMAPYSNTDAFLWNLRNFLKNTYFEEHVRKTASICFTSKYYNNKWWRVWTRRDLDRVHFIQSNAAI